MNITRTIQRHEDPKWVASFFDRSLEGEKAGWFPLPQVPRKAKAGDWVYVIYRGRIYGRLQITEVRRVNRADPVGSRGTQRVQARCRLYVRCPGQLAPKKIERRGHQGIRYDDVPEWGR